MDLRELAVKLYDAKKAEAEAKAARIEVEEAIAALVPTAERGSKTVEAGELKVTVKRGLNFKADLNAIRDIACDEDENDALPLTFVPASYEFDDKKYEELRGSNPELFARVARYVTTTPKKVAVELKLAT